MERAEGSSIRTGQKGPVDGQDRRVQKTDRTEGSSRWTGQKGPEDGQGRRG